MGTFKRKIRKLISSAVAVAMTVTGLTFAPVMSYGATKTLETKGTAEAPATAIKGAQNMGTIDNTAATTYWFGGNAFYGMKRNGIEFGEDYDTSDWLLADTDAMWNGNYLFSTWGNGYNNKTEDTSDLMTYSVNADADVTAKKDKNFYYQKILTYNEALYQQKVKNWLKGKEADAIGAATVTTTGGEYRTFEDHVQAASGEDDANKYSYYIGAMDVEANPLTAGFTYVIDFVKKWYESGQKDTSKYLPVNDGYPVLKGSAGATDQAWITKADGVVTYANKTGTYINSSDYNGITEADLGIKGSNIYSLKNAHLFSPSQVEYSGNEKVYKAIINNVRNDATSSTTDDVDVSSSSGLYYASSSIPAGSKGYPSAAKNGKYTWANAPKNPAGNLYDRTRTDLWSRSFSGLHVDNGDFGAWNVNLNGYLHSSNYLTGSRAVAPAFNLDTSSVTIARSANKGGTPKSNLDVYDANNLGSNVNFELQADADKLAIDTGFNGQEITNFTSGETFGIPYTISKLSKTTTQASDTKYYISAGIYDTSNKLLYYGQLKEVTGTGTGTAELTIPTELSNDKTYKLAVFLEQINGSYNINTPSGKSIETYTTDYASAMNIATFKLDYSGSENPENNGWENVTEGGITWHYTSDGVTADHVWTDAADISSLIKDGTLYVPSRINGLKVTGIGGGARNKTFVKADATGAWSSISFPVSLKKINDLAFAELTSLGSEIVIPEDVTVGKRAFESCLGIGKVTVNEGAVLSAGAFKNCTGITEIFIYTTELPEKSFEGCTGINKVILGFNTDKVDVNWNGQKVNPEGITNTNIAWHFNNGRTKMGYSDGYSAFGTSGDVSVYYNQAAEKNVPPADNLIEVTSLANNLGTYNDYFKGAAPLAHNISFSTSASPYITEDDSFQSGISASAIGSLYWDSTKGKGTELDKAQVLVKALFGIKRGSAYDPEHYYIVRSENKNKAKEELSANAITATAADLTKGNISLSAVTFEKFDGTEYTEIAGGERFTADFTVRVESYDSQGYFDLRFSDAEEALSLIGTLEQQVGEMTENAENLNNEITALQGEIASLNTEHAAELAAKVKEAEELQKRIEAKNAELNALKDQLKDMTENATFINEDENVVYIGEAATPYGETEYKYGEGSSQKPVYVTTEDAKDPEGNVIAEAGTYFYVDEDGIHKVLINGGKAETEEIPVTVNGKTLYELALATSPNAENLLFTKSGGNIIIVVRDGNGEYVEAADQSKAEYVKDLIGNGTTYTEVKKETIYSDSLSSTIATAQSQLLSLQQRLDEASASLNGVATGLASVITALLSDPGRTVELSLDNLYNYEGICNAIYDLISRLSNEDTEKKIDDLEKIAKDLTEANDALQEEKDRLAKENEDLKKKLQEGGGGYDDSITSVVVVFKPNRTGATVAERTKVVTNGEAYGNLPTPECPKFTFVGWYTEETNGSLVTSATTVLASTNTINLYAHWSEETAPAEDKIVTVSPNVADQPADGIIKAAESVVPGKAKYVISPSFNAIQVSTSDKKVAKVKLKKKTGKINVTTKKAGTTDIIVSGSNGESQTYRVYVETPKVNKNALKVSSTTVSMNMTDYVTGTKLLTPTKVSSSNQSVATISEDGTIKIAGSGKTKIALYFGKRKFKGTLKVS